MSRALAGILSLLSAAVFIGAARWWYLNGVAYSHDVREFMHRRTGRQPRQATSLAGDRVVRYWITLMFLAGGLALLIGGLIALFGLLG